MCARRTRPCASARRCRRNPILRIDAIIAAAKASGADAVHPGYGFLAENEAFAQACRDAGLVFIGPSPEAIKAMGNKAGAKAIMQAAGVPCVPGYQGADQSDAVMLAEAKKIGFPVMIKAVAGGGGRGMRLVADASGVSRRLAQRAIGGARRVRRSRTVILERAIVDPRHIEIQVFGDRLRQRHPSRRARLLGAAAASETDRGGAVASSVTGIAGADGRRRGRPRSNRLRYEGAGTLEFLLDGRGEFYFMEMNTRLQVEHPVTEAITGLDLVELQLRVASGEPLGLRQEDVRFSGHAIEVRLCSEDAAHDFMPQSGKMALWQMPDEIRVEHALQSGFEIPPFYDSMIAKLISHGATRDEARRRLIHGLEHTAAFGVTTNQAFLAACLRHPAFAAGEATTAFIGKHRDELLAHGERLARRYRARGAIAVCHRSPCAAVAERADAGGDVSASASHRSRSRAFMIVEIVRERDGGYVASPDGSEHRFEIDELGRDSIRFRANGLMQSARFFRDGDRLYILHRGVTFRSAISLWRRRPRRLRTGSDGKVRAAMNGRVVAVLVKAGRARRGRPAGDDAGSHEDGACACSADRRHDFRYRCRGRRAGDDGEDCGGDRGGCIDTCRPGLEPGPITTNVYVAASWGHSPAYN